jgi:hypothetical protein
VLLASFFIYLDNVFPPCLNAAAARLMASGVYGQSADANGSGCEGDEPLGSMKEMEAQTIGDLLPDDDDLISGITDGFEYTGLSNQDDADEDIFYTGGGLELEHDDSNNVDKFREVSFKSQLSGDVKEVMLLLNILCEIRVPNYSDDLLFLLGYRFTMLLQAAIRNL